MKTIEDILLQIFPNKSTTVKTRLLGGMMNETYIVSVEGKDCVLFLPQGNANEVVDREEEKFVQKIASDLEITSKNILFNTETGIKCHEFIHGDSLNKIEVFDYDEVAKILKIFHSSKILSHYDYKPFEKIKGYRYGEIRKVMEANNYEDDFGIC